MDRLDDAVGTFASPHTLCTRRRRYPQTSRLAKGARESYTETVRSVPHSKLRIFLDTGFSSVASCHSTQFYSDKVAVFRAVGHTIAALPSRLAGAPQIVQTQAAASELANQRASLLGT
jgi:hypothetical protein